MANLTTPQKARLAAIATALAALTAVVFVAHRPGFPDYTSGVLGGLSDAGFVHAGNGGDVTDLLSPEVPAGATGSTSVNLMPGAIADDVVPAAGFTNVTWQQTGVVVTVLFQNNTGRPAMFTGFLHFTPAPVDAGITDGP